MNNYRFLSSLWKKLDWFLPNYERKDILLGKLTILRVISSSLFQIILGRTVFDFFFQNVNTGTVNWNYSTIRSSSKIPIQGLSKSSSGITTSLFSVFYATYPASSIKFDKDAQVKFKGIEIV